MIWSFDCQNGSNDRSNTSYNGIEVNKPNNYTPDHSGLGYALNVRSTNQQYIRIPQFINLYLTSFTVSAWIYISEQSTNANPIFSQCTSSPNTDACLHYEIYSNNSLLFTFIRSDLYG